MTPVRTARFRATAAFMAAAGLALALSACTIPAPEAPAPSAPTGTVRTIASGLRTPWSLAFLPDGSELLSERDTGRILQLDKTGITRTVTTVDETIHNGEGGLLGLAVRQEHLYAYVTTAQDNRILRYPLTQTGGRAHVGAAETILHGLPAASYHNGGRIAFGPDGMLYVTVGDAGQSTRAQDREYLGGKILRLTPDGTVPADNPFPGSPVYSLGHRNPQGLDWDNDTLWAAEFGQDTWDELNRIQPGRNYGWPTVEGIASDDRFVDPVQQWSPENASPSGLTVPNGIAWIADLRGQNLRRVPLDDPSTFEVALQGEYGRLRDASTAPDGSLWLLTSNTDGRGTPTDSDDRVLRLDPTAGPARTEGAAP